MKGPILLSVLFFIFSCDNKTSTGVYKTTEYKKFNEKDRIIGESVWATSCFRCHLYGSNGAASLEDEEYWDIISEKELDELFNSVWKGKYGDKGAMPPKGLCNSCSEEQIKKSILYMFQLIETVQQPDSLNK